MKVREEGQRNSVPKRTILMPEPKKTLFYFSKQKKAFETASYFFVDTTKLFNKMKIKTSRSPSFFPQLFLAIVVKLEKGF